MFNNSKPKTKYCFRFCLTLPLKKTIRYLVKKNVNYIFHIGYAT